ncbi:MAG TPA: hypothetical protein VKU41_29890, partial [Polyangiaceae bacterium]|nr:hypothetical protein [Polyangiaceae bacterium]
AASVCLFAALLGMEADREMRASIGRGWVGTLLVLSYAGRFPSLVSDYQGHVEMKDGNGIVDSQREAWPSAGLSGLTLFRPIPDHESVRLGKDLHAHPERVPVWGGVGMAGFYAGSVGHVVDMHALTDALLARLPAPDASHETRDRIGHIIRRIPEGYVETFEKGSNQIKSPELAQYFDALRLVTSAPLFAPSRLRAMFGMWFGAYDPPLNAYLREYDRKAIRPGDLNHGEDHVPSSFYSYWAACADHGVAFTDTGAELELDAPVTTLTLHLENGAYDVTMLRDREWIAASAHYEGETVRLEAAQPFDRVYIDVAHDPARRWTLVSMDVPK